MTAGLTHRERDCLMAIAKLTIDGVAPTFEDIRAELGLASKSGVHRLIGGLKERRCVEYLPNQARSLRIVNQDFSPAALERLGTEDLRMLAAHVAGLLAHRQGGEATFQQLDRIGRRVSGRPVNHDGAHS